MSKFSLLCSVVLLGSLGAAGASFIPNLIPDKKDGEDKDDKSLTETIYSELFKKSKFSKEDYATIVQNWTSIIPTAPKEFFEKFAEKACPGGYACIEVFRITNLVNPNRRGTRRTVKYSLQT